MAQALDLGEGSSQPDSGPAGGAPISTAQPSTKFGTFAIAFGVAVPLLYIRWRGLDWPLFTF